MSSIYLGIETDSFPNTTDIWALLGIFLNPIDDVTKIYGRCRIEEFLQVPISNETHLGNDKSVEKVMR